MSIIFSIEGNIGSGKSTLVRKLKDYIAEKLNGRKIIYPQYLHNMYRSTLKSGSV